MEWRAGCGAGSAETALVGRMTPNNRHAGKYRMTLPENLRVDRKSLRAVGFDDSELEADRFLENLP